MKKFTSIPMPKWCGKLKILSLSIVLTCLSFTMAEAQNKIHLGEEGTSQSAYFPIYYLFNYSYSQTIYTAEEMQEQGAVAGTISKLYYKPNSSVSTASWKDWIVYIGQTDKDGFDGTEDWIAIDDLTEVFNDEIADEVTANEWLEIELENSFDWDGESNIVVAIDQNTSSWGNSPSWAGYELEPESGNKGIYYYSDSTNPDPEDPIEAMSVTNSIAQIQFYGDLLEECDGTPEGGEIAETDISVCAGVGFDLETEGASFPAGDLIRVWQSSPTGEEDWTDIEGAETPSFFLEEGVSEETDFRYKLVCGDDEPVYSNTLSVSLNPGEECYCTPTYIYSCSSGDRISNVTLEGESETLNNDSECSSDNYGDYSDDPDIAIPDLAPGEAYTISVSTDYGSPNFESYRAWIDYNKDGNFDDDEEIAFVNGMDPSGTSEVEFDVPSQVEAGQYKMRVRLVYGETVDIEDCIQASYGETEDYTVEIIQLEDCEGTVTAGDINEEDFSVCAGSSFSVSVSDASDPANGLDRQWQSSPAGEDDWTDIEGAHSNTYTAADGIEEPTDFRYVVTCENGGDTDTSETIEVTLNPAIDCYCTPENSDNYSYYHITNVSTADALEDIDNSTDFSEDGYGDYSDDQVIMVYAGQEFDFSISGTSSFMSYKVWVDFDLNGNFEGENELIIDSEFSVDSPYIETITIPSDLEEGEYRLRVRAAGSGTLDPCNDNGYGETEDYTLQVIELEDCEGPVTAGDIDEDFSVCAGTSFSISVSDASDPANGLDRQWQSSPAGEDDWTDIEDAHSSTYTAIDGIDEPTDFRYVVTCENGGDTDISETVEVTLNPALECYCTPENDDNYDFYYITNVSTNEALQDIDNTTDFSEDGYEDYTDSEIIVVYPGQEFDFSISGTSSFMSYKVWVDFDLNGNFEGENELIIDSEFSVDSPYIETITIPSDLEEGEYRLRVRGTGSGTLDPCNDNGYGETEDYILQVIYPDCFPPVSIQINYITDNSAQVTWEANDESEWTVIYGPEGFDPEDEGESLTVTEPLADLTDLDTETDYEVYVMTNCSDENSILMGPKSFTTNITPPENTRLCDAIDLEPNTGCIGGPYTNIAAFEQAGEPLGACLNDFHGTNSVWFTFVAPANGEVTVTTDFNSTDFNTELVAFEAPENCEDVTSLGEQIGCATAGNDMVMTDLAPGEIYYVRVAGFDQAEGEFCIEVQIDESQPTSCEDPSDITIGDVDATTAQVSWTANGEETQWEVLYGFEGFDPESEGETMAVTSTSVVLAELEPETSYDVYVRAICTSDFVSDWAGPEGFLTDELGVNDEVFTNFTYYPNPVENQLNLNANASIEKVEVFNLLGQRVISLTPNTLDTQMDTQNLESGVYLMKVTIDGAEKTFRIVKK